MTEWQPIETAPRDEEIILFWDVSEVSMGIMDDFGEWWVCDAWPHQWTELLVNPTHWMPLPEPPK